MQRSSLNRRCQPSVTYTDIQVTEKSRRDLRGCQLTLYSLKYGLYAIFRGPCLNVTRVFSSHVKTSGSGYLHDSPLRRRTKDVTLLAASHGSVCNTKKLLFTSREFASSCCSYLETKQILSCLRVCYCELHTGLTIRVTSRCSILQWHLIRQVT